jgi:hypothetical protein
VSGEPVEQTALKEAAEEMGSIVKLSSCQVCLVSFTVHAHQRIHLERILCSEVGLTAEIH